MTSKQKSYLQKRLTEIADKKINAINLLQYNNPPLCQLISDGILRLAKKEKILDQIPKDAFLDRYSHVIIACFFENYDIQLKLNDREINAHQELKKTRIETVQKELDKICDQIMFCNDAEALTAISAFENREF